jgi:hypothetical protein
MRSAALGQDVFTQGVWGELLYFCDNVKAQMKKKKLIFSRSVTGSSI